MKIIEGFAALLPSTLVMLSMLLLARYNSICLSLSTFILAVLIDHFLQTMFPNIMIEDYYDNKEKSNENNDDKQL